jgi:alanine dehydrogenase
VLLLSNSDVEATLTMQACVEVHEQMYRAMSEGRALHHFRRDTVTPGPIERSVHFHTINDGFFQHPTVGGVAALRTVSNLLRFPTRGQNTHEEVFGSSTGMVLLYSTTTGELLAMMQDSAIQRMRVAAAAGISVRFQSRPESTVLALLGSRYQAASALMAAAVVRPLAEVRVFSPTEANRVAFAERYARELGLSVRPTASAQEATDGADIILTTTSAIDPVLETDWVAPGTHVGTCKQQEVWPSLLNRAEVVTLHSRYSPFTDPYNVIVHADVREFPDFPAAVANPAVNPVSEYTIPDTAVLLEDVVGGKTLGRSKPEDITVFLNLGGLGVQFAAAGAVVLERARELGLGRELPGEWFTETRAGRHS